MSTGYGWEGLQGRYVRRCLVSAMYARQDMTQQLTAAETYAVSTQSDKESGNSIAAIAAASVA